MNTKILIALSVLFGLASIFFRALIVLMGRVGHYESKKAAQLKRKGARTLYAMQQAGYEPLIGLVIWQWLAIIGFILALSKLFSLLPSVLLATFVLTIVGEVWGAHSLPAFLKPRMDTFGKILGKILFITKPLSWPVAKLLDKRYGRAQPIIYSREHLFAILDRHEQSPMSDIDKSEIELIQRALKYKTLKVRKTMTPLEKLPVLSSTTEVGPIVMDELHKTGQKWFPMTEGSQDHVAGVVSLPRLTTMKTGGKVSKAAVTDVSFIDEGLSLLEVLDIYRTSHAQVFLVTNRFDDVVGLLTLEQLVGGLVGSNTVQPSETVVK